MLLSGAGWPVEEHRGASRADDRLTAEASARPVYTWIRGGGGPRSRNRSRVRQRPAVQRLGVQRPAVQRLGAPRRVRRGRAGRWPACGCRCAVPVAG